MHVHVWCVGASIGQGITPSLHVHVHVVEVSVVVRNGTIV